MVNTLRLNKVRYYVKAVKAWIRIHTIDKKLRLVKKLGKISRETWTKVLNSIWKSLLENKG